MPSGTSPLEQLANLKYEILIIINRRWWRWLTCWSAPGLWAIASYRLARASYLTFGRAHVLLKFALSPVLFVLRPWIGTLEIHYKADIGRGLRILHPGLGVVVSGATVAGRGLVLTGGNCIGGKKHVKSGDIWIGNNVFLGANAVVLGPIRIGDNVQVGAGAVVVHDAEEGQVLIGVPAVSMTTRSQRSRIADGASNSTHDRADASSVQDLP